MFFELRFISKGTVSIKLRYKSIFNAKPFDGFLVLIFFFWFKKKEIKKRTNRGPPRTGGARKQCKNQTKIGPYFITFVIGFYGFCGTSGLRNPLITWDKDGLNMPGFCVL